MYSLFYSVWYCCSVASVYLAPSIELRVLETFRKINWDRILEIYKDNADNEGLKKGNLNEACLITPSKKSALVSACYCKNFVSF